MSTSGGSTTVSESLPTGTSVKASSGNAANAVATAALAAAAGKTTVVDGFIIAASGSTAALVVLATLTDGVTTLTFPFAFPAGATTAAQPLIVSFANPLPAAAPNTGWTLSLPAGGAGNTNAAVNIYGRQI